MTRTDGQIARVENRSGLAGVENKMGRIAEQLSVVVGADRIELPVAKTDRVSCRSRESGRNIQAGIGAKHNPHRIHQVQIRRTARDLNCAVDRRSLTTDHAS